MAHQRGLEVLERGRDVAVLLVERRAALALEVPLALGVELVREAGALVRPGDVDALLVGGDAFEVELEEEAKLRHVDAAHAPAGAGRQHPQPP